MSWVVALSLGGGCGATGTTVPLVTNPPNWIGVQQIRGFGPSARLALGPELGAWTVGAAVTGWGAYRPKDVRNGQAHPQAAQLALLQGGLFADRTLTDHLSFGADVGVSGVLFRPADGFDPYTRPGFGFGGRLGWQSDGALGVELGTNGHVAMNTGPVGTMWSGGEVALRARVAL